MSMQISDIALSDYSHLEAGDRLYRVIFRSGTKVATCQATVTHVSDKCITVTGAGDGVVNTYLRKPAPDNSAVPYPDVCPGECQVFFVAFDRTMGERELKEVF